MFDLYVHGTALKIFFNLWDEAVKSKASSITESLWSFLSILVFPSSTATFSGSVVGFILKKNFFPFSLRSPWQSFKSLEAKLVKLYFDWALFIVFKLYFFTKIAWDGKRPLFKIFSSILHFIAASVVDIIVLRMNCYFP